MAGGPRLPRQIGAASTWLQAASYAPAPSCAPLHSAPTPPQQAPRPLPNPLPAAGMRRGRRVRRVCIHVRIATCWRLRSCLVRPTQPHADAPGGTRSPFTWGAASGAGALSRPRPFACAVPPRVVTNRESTPQGPPPLTDMSPPPLIWCPPASVWLCTSAAAPPARASAPGSPRGGGWGRAPRASEWDDTKAAGRPPR